jgi:hypothetical protein
MTLSTKGTAAEQDACAAGEDPCQGPGHQEGGLAEERCGGSLHTPRWQLGHDRRGIAFSPTYSASLWTVADWMYTARGRDSQETLWLKGNPNRGVVNGRSYTTEFSLSNVYPGHVR